VLRRDRRHGEDVEALADAVRGLTESLSEAQALSATWDDIESAVRNLDFFAVVESLGQLEAQLSLAGRDGERVLNEVRQVIQRNTFAFWGGVESEGESSAPPDRDEAARIAASMSVDGVLALARKTLIQPGNTGHVVVFSLYDRAMASGGATELGPVTLYMPQWIIAVAFAENPASAPPFVEEVRQLRHAQRDYDEGYHFRLDVLVRIDLGVRSTVGAFEAADDLVDTLMDALISAGSMDDGVKPVGPSCSSTERNGRLASAVAVGAQTSMTPSAWEP
jgi:hypothetical protein